MRTARGVAVITAATALVASLASHAWASDDGGLPASITTASCTDAGGTVVTGLHGSVCTSTENPEINGALISDAPARTDDAEPSATDLFGRLLGGLVGH
jgi:hypothetical protein